MERVINASVVFYHSWNNVRLHNSNIVENSILPLMIIIRKKLI